MFVIAAAERSGGHTSDAVQAGARAVQWRDIVTADYGARLALPADHTSGDELEILSTDAGTILEIVLRLTRSGAWSVGLGIGPVRQPLPAQMRDASGAAFTHARAAAVEAQKRPTRFAVQATQAADDWPSGGDVQGLIDPVLELRRKRSPQGWELYDVLTTVNTQASAAQQLGITAAAASDRALAAALRIERDALPSIVRMLDALDQSGQRAMDQA